MRTFIILYFIALASASAAGINAVSLSGEGVIHFDDIKRELASDTIIERERPFIRREFLPYLKDKWIGNAVSYGGYRKGQSPGKKSPSDKQILEDLSIISKHWNFIRLYSADDNAESVLRIIKKKNFKIKVMLGTWLESAEANPAIKEANTEQVLHVISLANRYPENVLAVSVGNETQVFWSGHRMSPASLVKYIRIVRKYTRVPVTTADDYNFWNKPESNYMADECDFIAMHIYPLWNGIVLENAISWMDGIYHDVQKMHPDRAVIIGETGWATNYNHQKIGPGEQGTLIKGEVSAKAQAKFLAELNSWLRKNKVVTFLFEAFDESWKGGGEASSPEEIEKHWGLYGEDRKPKESFGKFQRCYHKRTVSNESGQAGGTH
jgi:exo-beta-1,3-glucanase (GH17 family)